MCGVSYCLHTCVAYCHVLREKAKSPPARPAYQYELLSPLWNPGSTSDWTASTMKKLAAALHTPENTFTRHATFLSERSPKRLEKPIESHVHKG
jgi:hypothetical protein